MGWGAAALRGAIVLIACGALLIYLPNRLLTFLATRVSPNVRDGIVTLWEIVFFVVLAWVFVAAQSRRS